MAKDLPKSGRNSRADLRKQNAKSTNDYSISEAAGVLNENVSKAVLTRYIGPLAGPASKIIGKEGKKRAERFENAGGGKNVRIPKKLVDNFNIDMLGP